MQKQIRFVLENWLIINGKSLHWIFRDNYLQFLPTELQVVGNVKATLIIALFIEV